MNPYLHTAIAVGLMLSCYIIGRHFGYRSGMIDVWVPILEAFKAKSIEITDDDEVIVTDTNGEKRKVN
jgi:hypothetical protein